MKYFVINLDKREDRWKNMKKQLEKQNLLEKTTRFSAIERTWTTVPFEKLSDSFLCKLVEGNRYSSLGAIGAYESHMKLWETCLELDEPIVVFEDDIQFTCLNFEKALENIVNEIKTNTKTEIDMITFFATSLFENIEKEYKDSYQVTYPIFGAFGYYITPQFIKKVQKHMSILDIPFDVQLMNYCKRISTPIHCFLSKPFLIQTPTELNRDSNIKNEKRLIYPKVQQVTKREDCDYFRERNIPFLYCNPNCFLKFNIFNFSWYNPVSHFILKKNNNITVLELFRNNKNDPIIWNEVF